MSEHGSLTMHGGASLMHRDCTRFRCSQRVVPGLVSALVSIFIAMPLSACGGGTGADPAAEIALLREQAAAKEAQARALALDTPCAENNQCAGLLFGFTSAACGPLPQVPYSLASTSARQAEAAAAEQKVIAARIIALQYPAGLACPAVFTPQPAVSCSAGKCVQAP